MYSLINIQVGETNDGREYAEIETPEGYKIESAYQIGSRSRIDFIQDITDQEQSRRVTVADAEQAIKLARAYNVGREDAYNEMRAAIEDDTLKSTTEIIERLNEVEQPQEDQVEATEEEHQAANPYNPGDKVMYNNQVRIVYGLYGPEHVSLTLKNFNDTEQDHTTLTKDIRPATPDEIAEQSAADTA